MTKFREFLLVGFAAAVVSCASSSAHKSTSKAGKKANSGSATSNAALAQNTKAPGSPKSKGKKAGSAKKVDDTPVGDVAWAKQAGASDFEMKDDPGAKKSADVEEQVGDPSFAPAMLGDDDDAPAEIPTTKEDLKPIDGGKLTTADIKNVISKGLITIKACYTELLKRDPDAEGRVNVAFTIGGTGSVIKDSATKDSTLTDAVLQQCLLKKLSSWKFPTTYQGIEVDVTYPFEFKPMQSE